MLLTQKTYTDIYKTTFTLLMTRLYLASVLGEKSNDPGSKKPKTSTNEKIAKLECSRDLEG